MQIDGNKIKLPKFGWVKCSELLPDIKKESLQGASVTISLKAGQWYISYIKKEQPDRTIEGIQDLPAVGVDMGIKTKAVMSNGVEWKNNRPTKNNAKRLKRESRKLSRKKKGSNNYNKQKIKVQRYPKHSTHCPYP